LRLLRRTTREWWESWIINEWEKALGIQEKRLRHYFGQLFFGSPVFPPEKMVAILLLNPMGGSTANLSLEAPGTSMAVNNFGHLATPVSAGFLSRLALTGAG